MDFFAKQKRIKIGLIWPLQLHFWSTDAYRGSPPYAIQCPYIYIYIYIYIFPIPDTKKYSIVLCYHKPQATIRLIFHRAIAGILCCQAIVSAIATITNIRRSISPPFCFQGKRFIAPIMWVHPFILPPRFGRIKEHEIEYLTHTTDPEIDFGHQMAPLGTVLNFTSVCTTSWTDSLSDIGTYR